MQPTAEAAHFVEGVLVEQLGVSEAVGLMSVSVSRGGVGFELVGGRACFWAAAEMRRYTA